MQTLSVIDSRIHLPKYNGLEDSSEDFWFTLNEQASHELPAYKIYSDGLDPSKIDGFRKTFSTVERYATVLERGKIWGDRRVVDKNNRLLIDLSRWRADEVYVQDSVENIDVPDAQKHVINETAFLLTYGYAAVANLSHFIVDVMTCIDGICRLPERSKIVVHDNISEFFEEMILSNGISRERIIKINSNDIYEFSKLIVPLPAQSMMMSNSKQIWDSIRSRGNRMDRAQRIYISRSDTKFGTGRNLLNEDEIEEVFKEFGFDILFGRELTIEKSTSLMGSADIIAGPYGAGLYHSIFARPKTNVIAMTHNRYWVNDLHQIAAINDLNLHMLVGPHFDCDDHHFRGTHSNFIISPELVRQALSEVIGASKLSASLCSVSPKTAAL